MLAEVVAVNRFQNFRSEISAANDAVLEWTALQEIQRAVQRWIEAHPEHPSVTAAFWVLDKFVDPSLRPFLREWLGRCVERIVPHMAPLGQILVNLNSLGESSFSGRSFSCNEYGKNLEDAIRYLRATEPKDPTSMPRTTNTKVSPSRKGPLKLKPGLVATDDYAVILAPYDQKTLAQWGADCAEHVLHLFEIHHPEDGRPRQAIATARAWARGEVKMMVARGASVKTHAAAREASDPAAVAVARAAGHAVATAHSIRHARGAAAYAIVAVVATTAESVREAAVAAEREWQLARLPAER